MALSGGVDSALAARLLLDRGHAVTGFFMRLGLADEDGLAARARAVAANLGIAFEVVDLRQSFSRYVIQYFLDSYRRGLTPNPCVVCNRRIKFGLLMDAMLTRGMDRVATGHYARIGRQGDQWDLYRSGDPNKDQSYFLCRIPPERLARVILPLGDWRKDQVIRRAHELKLGDFSRGESQDVCFLSTGVCSFLEQKGVDASPGEIVSRDGQVLGHHRGMAGYTIGQRRGLGISDRRPWYVLALDRAANRIVVGREEDLYQARVPLADLHWRRGAPQAGWRGEVRLRSSQSPVPVKLAPGGRHWHLVCRDPQRAVTPGQFAVLYEGERVAGSGVIAGTEREP